MKSIKKTFKRRSVAEKPFLFANFKQIRCNSTDLGQYWKATSISDELQRKSNVT